MYFFFFFTDTATTEIYTLSLHDALPICCSSLKLLPCILSLRPDTKNEPPSTLLPDFGTIVIAGPPVSASPRFPRSEEHTSELQSLAYLVCRLLLEKKKKKKNIY